MLVTLEDLLEVDVRLRLDLTTASSAGTAAASFLEAALEAPFAPEVPPEREASWFSLDTTAFTVLEMPITSFKGSDLLYFSSR